MARSASAAGPSKSTNSPAPIGMNVALYAFYGLFQNSSEDQLHHYMWARCCGVHQHPVRRILRLAILKQPVY